MQVELLLLLLRVASACILLTLLTAVFVIMWKQFRATTMSLEPDRGHYGQLVDVRESDTTYTATGESHDLLPTTYIGRAPTNNVIIDDSFASAEHALIVLRDGQWWLEDRNSRNGTALNGAIIEKPVVITRGDIIGIGQKRFRFDLE